MAYRGFTAWCRYDEEKGEFMLKVNGVSKPAFEAGFTIEEAWNAFSDFVDEYLVEEVKEM